MRGRRPKPVELKLLEGNAGKRIRRADAEAVRTRGASAVPPCPKSLKGDARREFDRLAPALAQAGLLLDTDIGMFIALCEAWGRYREYEALCTKVGPGDAVRLRYRRAADDSFKRYLRTSMEFGLSPSARGGSKVPASKLGQRPATAKDALRSKYFGRVKASG